MTEAIRIIDIRTEDGDEVLIEFSNGKIVALSVKEILRAVGSVAVQPLEHVN